MKPQETIKLPEKHQNQIFFKKQPIFTRALRKPSKGEKVYSLTQDQINEIKQCRSERVELDPGMGGVVPTKIRAWMKEGIKITSLDFMLTKVCKFKCTRCT